MNARTKENEREQERESERENEMDIFMYTHKDEKKFT